MSPQVAEEYAPYDGDDDPRPEESAPEGADDDDDADELEPLTHLTDDDYDAFVSRELRDGGVERSDPPVAAILIGLTLLIVLVVLLLA